MDIKSGEIICKHHLLDNSCALAVSKDGLVVAIGC